MNDACKIISFRRERFKHRINRVLVHLGRFIDEIFKRRSGQAMIYGTKNRKGSKSTRRREKY